jgi:hypothetical protein
MLNDAGTVNVVLVVGIIVALWCGFKLWPLERKKVRLKKSMQRIRCKILTIQAF